MREKAESKPVIKNHEYLHHSSDSFNRPAHRCIAGMALQQRLGLLPKWWLGVGSFNFSRPLGSRKIMKALVYDGVRDEGWTKVVLKP
jgi:hypothetical protein